MKATTKAQKATTKAQKSEHSRLCAICAAIGDDPKASVAEYLAAAKTAQDYYFKFIDPVGK